MTHVYTRFNDWAPAAIEKSRAYDADKADIIFPMRTLSFSEQNKLVAPDSNVIWGLRDYELTNRAFNQLAGRIGAGSMKNMTIFGEYPWAYETTIGAACRDGKYHNLQRGGEKQIMARTGEDGVRAIFSDKYSVFDNTEVIESVHKTLRDMGIDENAKVLTSSNVTPDTMVMKVLYPDKGGLWRGFTVINSENGSYSLKVMSHVLRTSCTNSLIAGSLGEEGTTTVRKAYKEKAEFKYLMAQQITIALNMSSKVVTRLAEVAYEELTDPAGAMVNALKAQFGNKAYEQHLGDAMYGMEQSGSLGGVINGLTYLAHAGKDLTEQQRIETELLAGEILNMSLTNSGDEIAGHFFALANRARISEDEFVD